VAELPDTNNTAAFVVNDINGVWKLWGVHPRWGSQWECLCEVKNGQLVKITGRVGDIFKLNLPGFDYRFVTIDEKTASERLTISLLKISSIQSLASGILF
jgi:hypothetical protein